MKENIKHLLHIIIFFVIVGIVVSKVGDVLEKKDSRIKYNDFFEYNQNYDVIFLGTSHVQCGISPMTLYNDYGITSYNFGNGSSYMKATYYTLKNILDYKTPKLIVVDTYNLGSDISAFGRFSYAHAAFDIFPISKSKIEAANNLFESNEEKIEMLFPFVKYHSRWTELTNLDFGNHRNLNKGANIMCEFSEYALKPEIIPSSSYSEEMNVGKEYLEKLLILAESKGIKVLVITIPYPSNIEEQLAQNYAYKLAKIYNAEYLNLLEVPDLIDYKTDMADENSHLNLSGAKKVSSYLGRYISDNYELEDCRNNQAINQLWLKDYASYIESGILTLNQINDYKKYLVGLTHEAFECRIKLSEGVTESRYPLIYRLINNIPEMRKIELREYSNISDSNNSNIEYGNGDINIIVYKRDSEEIVSQKSFKLD